MADPAIVVWEWRPGMLGPPTEDHLARIGQGRWWPTSESRDPRPYVWSVCGVTAAAEGDPVGVRCDRCSQWLAERPEIREAVG